MKTIKMYGLAALISLGISTESAFAAASAAAPPAPPAAGNPLTASQGSGLGISSNPGASNLQREGIRKMAEAERAAEIVKSLIAKLPEAQSALDKVWKEAKKVVKPSYSGLVKSIVGFSDQPAPIQQKLQSEAATLKGKHDDKLFAKLTKFVSASVPDGKVLTEVISEVKRAGTLTRELAKKAKEVAAEVSPKATNQANGDVSFNSQESVNLPALIGAKVMASPTAPGQEQIVPILVQQASSFGFDSRPVIGQSFGGATEQNGVHEGDGKIQDSEPANDATGTPAAVPATGGGV